MSKFRFRLPREESLVLVDCRVGAGNYTMALDTGASHTIIDLTALLIVGIDPVDSIRKEDFETAGGIVTASVFLLPSFTALGLTRHDFEVCAYDFIGTGIVSEFDGMLGLDFFRGTDLFISFKRFEISLD